MLDQISDPRLSEELIAHRGTVTYLDYLSTVERTIGAQSYLEIGTQQGASLAAVSCASIAIDPCLALSREVVGKKPACLLFQMTSDDFFKTYDPVQLLQRKLDLAFLDGMHLYEFLLRDIINTERCCHGKSVIALHDCLPPTFEMTSRQCRGATLNDRYLNYWTGDVWKVIPILQKYRTDMKIAYIDAPPTGLVLLANLDPSSRVLSTSYDRIVEDFRESPDDFDRLRSVLRRITLTSGMQQPVF